MENYTGKICPFCKAEIKEGDAVKVCPSCGIPHHEACWTENNGCTTFGCSEQHYEEQHTNPTDVCVNCGAPLGDGQEFCPKCGTPKGGKKKRVCAKCGAELEDGQAFCPMCGQKADLQVDAGVNSAISQFNADVARTNEQAKKKRKTIGIIAALAILAVVLAVVLASTVFASVGTLCAKGQYEKAYAKASAGEKNKVLAENMIAYLSPKSSENLHYPSSFVLEDAYYRVSYNDDDKCINQQAVLYLSCQSVSGGSVSSYRVWTADKNGKWSLLGSCMSLDQNMEDDNYLTSLTAQKLIEDENAIHLSKTSVENINNAFKKDALDSLVLIENETFDISALPKEDIGDMDRGNYENAYRNANADEKEDILIENAVAVVSNMAAEGVSSFELRAAWYDDEKIVLLVAGNNGYGNKVTEYWYYAYSDDEGWELQTTYSDLSEDPIYSWDSDFDKLFKKISNAFLSNTVIPMTSDQSLLLEPAGILRINALLKAGSLDNVTLIEQ